MKKTLSVIFLIGFLTVLLVPVSTSAQAPPLECCKLGRSITIDDTTCSKGSFVGPEGGDCGENSIGCATESWGMFCLMNTLYSITDWVFVILVGLSGIFVIIGALTLLMAAGVPEKVNSGRNYIIYAMVGLIVGLLSKAIPSLVRMLGGM